MEELNSPLLSTSTSSSSLHRLRVVVASSPRTSFRPWPQQSAEARQHVRKLVIDLLALVSGGHTEAIIRDIADGVEQDRDDRAERLYPSRTSSPFHDDAAGYHSAHTLTVAISQMQPLKPWSLRNPQEQQVKSELISCGRRVLSHLSGGSTAHILDELLTDDEKDAFCSKYKLALVQMGWAARSFPPTTLAALLTALKDAGFSKDELRDMDWTFSAVLWRVSSYLAGRGPIREATARLATASVTKDLFSGKSKRGRGNAARKSPAAASPDHEEEETTTTRTTMTTVTTTWRKRLNKHMPTLLSGSGQELHPFGMTEETK